MLIELSPPVVFIAAYLADWLIGDPPWLPHPVRWMGRFIRFGEGVARRACFGPTSEFILGTALTAATVGGSYIAGWLVLAGLGRSPAGFMVALYLGATTLATRNLLDEVRPVVGDLEGGDLPAARRRVGRVVGRDTATLDEAGVVRAAVETLAESTSDGIVAPMLYFALGGVPLALAYKAVNTLDSMIGHRDDRYFFFGKFAARLDDLANFLPARLTAGLVVLGAAIFGKNWRAALRIWLRDAGKHASPNAGRPEAALAGALDVQLGGLNFYAGEPHDGAKLGDPLSPLTLSTLRSALTLTALVSWLSFALLGGVLWWSMR